MQMDFIFIDAETKATHSYFPGKRKMKIKVTSFTNGAPGFEETLTCSKNIKLGK